MATGHAGVKVTENDVPKLFELLLPVAGDWKLFLGAIGVTSNVQKEIMYEHAQYPNSAKLCLRDGLERWVESDDAPTYNKIINALRGGVVTNIPLAEKVEELAKKKSPSTVEVSAPPLPGSTCPTEPVTAAMSTARISQPATPSATCFSTVTKPAATEEKPSFPQLPTGTMTAHERDVLEGRLSFENDAIQTDFAHLVFGTCKSLNDRINLREAVFFLSQCHCVQQREEAPKEYKNDLRNAQSMYDAFDAITPFFSFFGYSLIAAIIANFGTDEDKQRLTEYEQRFNAFCKRRVYECPIEAFGSKGTDDTLLVVKLNDEFENFTLKAVAQFRTKLSTILGVPDYALRFIGAAEGCVELQFAAVSSWGWVIFPLSGQQRESLRGEGVLELRGGEHCYLLSSTGDKILDVKDKTALFEAAGCGDSARVAWLLGRGMVDVNARDELSRTALMLAAEAGCIDTVQVLLASGADTSVQDMLGQPALMWAARTDNTGLVEVLLASGADTNIQDKEKQTALMDAARGGHAGIVQALLACGADTNIQNELGKTALILAADGGYTGIVETLLASGADANLQDDWGQTALRKATRSGHTATVRALLASGARANIQDMWSGTALMDAARGGHVGIVQALLASGADTNIQDEYGDTALLVAFTDAYEYDEDDNEVEKVIDESLIKALIDGGSDLNCQEQVSGWTPLFFAAKRDSLSLVKLLLARGADPKIRDKAETMETEYFKNFERCRSFGWFLPQEVYTAPLSPQLELRRGAVLFLISERQGEPHVLITTRSRQLNTHSGENALPGGMMEAQDTSVADTACREAFEEVHLERSAYDVIAVLPPFFAGVRMNVIYPVVAVAKTKDISLSLSNEVEHYFWVPLRTFLQAKNSRYVYFHWREDRHSHTVFDYEEPGSKRKQLIWGFTSRLCILLSAIALNTNPEFPVTIAAISKLSSSSITLQALALTAEQYRGWSGKSKL